MYREVEEIEERYPQLRGADSPTMSVGGSVDSGFSEVRHLAQMMSLDDVFSLEELAGWETRMAEATGISGPQGFLVGGTRKATLVVKDTQVGELPKAGSTGIFPYIGVATALMSGAMVITVVTTKRRKALA